MLVAMAGTNDVQVELVLRRERLAAQIAAPRVAVRVQTAVEQVENRVVEVDATVVAALWSYSSHEAGVADLSNLPSG